MKYILWFTLLLLTRLIAAAAPINSHCPVTPEDEIAPGFSINYEGREIGFCSDRCLHDFKGSPTTYLANLPAPVSDDITPESSTTDGHGETEHGHDESPLNRSHSEVESTSQEADEHDHASDHGEPGSSWLGKMAVLLGKLHVLAVHLPIGLLSFAAFFELVGWWRKAPVWHTVSQFNFVAGSVAALSAAPLGWLAAANANYSPDLQDTLQVHRWLGVTTALLALGGLILLWLEKRSPSPRPTLYRILILLVAIIVPLTAHFGGSLIYGPDYLLSGF